MISDRIFGLMLVCTFLFGCSAIEGVKAPSEVEGVEGNEEEKELAVVLSVNTSGSEGAYTFSVQVRSPDTGCDQYADWWEVIGEDGSLKYRRILLHSHVSEQPFTRSGGPVPIKADELVYVRAHMNNAGFGSQVISGTVGSGFKTDELETDFAKELAQQEPLPKDCDF